MNSYKEKILKHKEFFLWHFFGVAYRKNEYKYGIALREDRIVFFQNIIKSKKIKNIPVNKLKKYAKKYVIKKKKEFEKNKSTRKKLELSYLFPDDFAIEQITPPKFYNGEKNIICFSVFSNKKNTSTSNFILCYKNEILLSIYFPNNIGFDEIRTIEYLTVEIHNSSGNSKNKKGSKANIRNLTPILKVTDRDSSVKNKLGDSVGNLNIIIRDIHDISQTMLYKKFLCEYMLQSFTKVLTDKKNIFNEAKNYLSLEPITDINIDIERSTLEKEVKSFSKQLLKTSWNNLTENEEKLKQFEESTYKRVDTFYKGKTEGLFSDKGWVELENIFQIKKTSDKIKKIKTFAKSNPFIASFLAMSSNKGFKMLLSFNPITIGISFLVDYFIDELIAEFFEESEDFLNLREDYSAANFADDLLNKTIDKANKYTQDVSIPLLQQLANVFNESYIDLESNKSKEKLIEKLKKSIITAQSELNNIHNKTIDARSYYENLWEEISDKINVKINDVPEWYKSKTVEDEELIEILLDTNTAFMNACNPDIESHLIKANHHIVQFNYCLALHLFQQRDERFSYEILYSKVDVDYLNQMSRIREYSKFVDGKNIKNISNYFSDLNNQNILKSFFRFQNDSGEKTEESVIKRIYFLYSYKSDLASVLNSIFPNSFSTQAFFNEIIENGFIQVNYVIKNDTKNILANILNRMLGPWIDRLNWDTIESSFAYNFTKETYGPKKTKPFGYDYELIKSRMSQSDIHNIIGLYYVVNFRALNSFENTLDSIEIEFYNDYFSDYNSVIIGNSPVPKKVLYKAICYL